MDCAKDVPVEFGDVIEIPERVHALNETTPGPVTIMETEISLAKRGQMLPSRPSRFPAAPLSPAQIEVEVKATLQRWACLQKPVQLVIGGETTLMTVDSWKEGFLERALAKTEARAVLRSSSDLSRVKVKRKDAKSGKPVVLTVDITDTNVALWLQAGDVIEVPDKP